MQSQISGSTVVPPFDLASVVLAMPEPPMVKSLIELMVIERNRDNHILGIRH